MNWIAVSILTLAASLGWATICRRLLDNPRGDVPTGLFFWFARVYCQAWHRLDIQGTQHIPRERVPGALIVVANHTAGIDPILIQAACPFEIRWMMARDMMEPALDGFWQWSGVIPVDRFSRDTSSARAAISHLKHGGVLGVFPEGFLERPVRHITPFQPGLGLIAARTGSRILPVIVDGTPQVDPAWASALCPSRSRVRFMPMLDYSGKDWKPERIVEDIRRRFLEWTGWPESDGTV